MATTYILVLKDTTPVATFLSSSIVDACKIAKVMRTRYKVAAKANGVKLTDTDFRLIETPVSEIITWKPTDA